MDILTPVFCLAVLWSCGHAGLSKR